MLLLLLFFDYENTSNDIYLKLYNFVFPMHKILLGSKYQEL